MSQQAGSGPARGPFDLPGPHLVVPEFLGAGTVARLLDHAAEHRAAFQPSRVGAQEGEGREDPTRRVSLWLGEVPELAPVITGRVREVLGEVFSRLDVPAFEPSRWEVELVAHGHGAFFSRHVDTMVGSPDAAEDRPRSARNLSMVYYFSRTPRRFSGGALRLHSLAASGAPGTYADIEPESDTALFFPSWFPHEVLPVTCESRDFMDSRFAVNCWLYK